MKTEDFFCPTCQIHYTNNILFCSKCGRQLESKTLTQAEQHSPPINELNTNNPKLKPLPRRYIRHPIPPHIRHPRLIRFLRIFSTSVVTIGGILSLLLSILSFFDSLTGTIDDESILFTGTELVGAIILLTGAGLLISKFKAGIIVSLLGNVFNLAFGLSIWLVYYYLGDFTPYLATLSFSLSITSFILFPFFFILFHWVWSSLH